MTSNLRVVRAATPVCASTKMTPIVDDADYFYITEPGLYRFEGALWSAADAEKLGFPTRPDPAGTTARVERKLVNPILGLTIRPALDVDIQRAGLVVEGEIPEPFRLRIAAPEA